MALSEAERRRLIDLSATKKFGRWWVWEKPVLGHSIGPSNPHAFDNFAEGLAGLRTVCQDMLVGLSDQELLALQNQVTEQDRKVLEWYNKFLIFEVNNLASSCPTWLAAGFGHPDARADFEYWGKIARYSLHEVLMLSVGVDPEFVAETLTEVPKRSESQKTNPQIKFIRKRRVLLRGHFPSTDWGVLAVPPNWIKSLIDEISLDVHPEFYGQLEQRVVSASPPVSAPAQITDHERNSLLKLIAAMAAEQYSFDPKNSRSSATSAIESDLSVTGLSLDRKTILKHLREAAALIDASYWTKS